MLLLGFMANSQLLKKAWFRSSTTVVNHYRENYKEYLNFFTLIELSCFCLKLTLTLSVMKPPSALHVLDPVESQLHSFSGSRQVPLRPQPQLPSRDSWDSDAPLKEEGPKGIVGQYCMRFPELKMNCSLIMKNKIIYKAQLCNNLQYFAIT